MSNTVNEKAQERAAHAFNAVQGVYSEGKFNKKEYKSYVKNIPAYIKTNGLAATVAFAYSRDKVEYKEIVRQIQNWLIECKCLENVEDTKDATKFVKWLMNLSSDNYRIATIEVISYFDWLRRFVDGIE